MPTSCGSREKPGMCRWAKSADFRKAIRWIFLQNRRISRGHGLPPPPTQVPQEGHGGVVRPRRSRSESVDGQSPARGLRWQTCIASACQVFMSLRYRIGRDLTDGRQFSSQVTNQGLYGMAAAE